MSYKIVVARYNESIEWLNSEIHNCLIYNKGEKLNVENEIMLNNIGRESETYLNYIITNYDNLPDVVVFTQAKISDHIDENKDDISYLLKLKEQAFNNNKSTPNVIYPYLHNQKWWGNKWNINDDGSYALQNNYLNNMPIIFEDWFKQHINPIYPNPIFIYANGIFAVKKELILNNPIDYYKKLILQVNHHINSTEGHFFERSWYYIFKDIKLEKKNKPKIGITLGIPKEINSLFNNGIKQNAIFFYKLLSNIGKYDVHFIIDRSTSDNGSCLDNLGYKYIKSDNILGHQIDIIFTFDFMLPVDTYLILKERGTKQILYNCGNLYMIESEGCLFNTKERAFIYERYNIFDECWNLPHMENTNHFWLKTLLRCDKVIAVPYIWSPELIDKEENKYKKRTENKAIAIFEPNISIMKWAFPAILICENAYRNPEISNKITKVYATNIWSDTNSESKKQFSLDNFNKLVKSLDLRKDNKITIEARYNALFIMSRYADIVVSHTWENWLNNLYFDIAWMGWPIVHNGKFCKEIGYYYDEFNYEMGGNALKDAILNHDDNADEYILRNRLYMQKYLPTNKGLKKQYEDLVTATLATINN